MTIPVVSADVISAMTDQSDRFEGDYSYLDSVVDKMLVAQPDIVQFATDVSNKLAKLYGKKRYQDELAEKIFHCILWPVAGMYNQEQADEMEEI